jgi:hypothetical protein
MKATRIGHLRWAAFAAGFAVLACNLGTAAPPKPRPTSIQGAITPEAPPTAQANSPEPATAAPPSATATITHVLMPSESVSPGKLIYDVVSQDTASEKRAPYGDSYDINRLERPFLQDMTYVPDLDIASFQVKKDENWWYVSVELAGTDPNNALGVDYGVELDLDHDGFGDYLIWAHPPYSPRWATEPVQIFQDKNHDTGGRSAEKSDAPITTDGYETLVFNGGKADADPDLAWMRTDAGAQATVQFAFKQSWSGTVFMLGVISDAGLKDPKKMDYVDRFTAAEAGSPVRDNKNYPLGAIFAVDSVCRAAFGFNATGYEPQLCPSTEPPATKRPRTPSPPTEGPVLGPPPPALCLPAGTLIDTPRGPRAVEQLRIGDAVWSADSAGARFLATIRKISRVQTEPGHVFVHTGLADGREVWASPGHLTADGRTFAQLKPGGFLDGALVTLVEIEPSSQSATYDLLPSGDTGFYWANGVLIGSTLHQ